MCLPKAPDMSAQKREAERQAAAEQERRKKDKEKSLDRRKAAAGADLTSSLANFSTAARDLRSFFAPTGG